MDSEDKTLMRDFCSAEVQQEPHLHSCGFQFIQQLSFIALVVFRRDFDLHYDTTVNQKVRIVISYNDAFVEHLNPLLDFGGRSAAQQLYLQRSLIHPLKKAVPKLLMHLERRSDNLLGNIAMEQVDRMNLVWF